jgi:hypothetical protein
MVVWENLFVSIVFPTCVSIPIFQTFEMGLEKFEILKEKKMTGMKSS